MINSLLFGGAEGYDALRRKVESLEMDLGETCSGGCEHWEKTRDGRQRFAELKRINQERKRAGLSHVA